jgi:hypothetical protein
LAIAPRKRFNGSITPQFYITKRKSYTIKKPPGPSIVAFSTSEVADPGLKGRLAHQEFPCPRLYGASIL